MKRFLLYGLFFCCGTSIGRSCGQDSVAPTGDESTVRETAAAYLQAFNDRNTDALVALWSPDAVYANRITGEDVVGRQAIAEQFKALFAYAPKLKLTVDVESVRFLSPNVAVENGTARFLSDEGEPDEVRYGAVYVKRDGKWLLDRVTDEKPEATAAHYEQLKALEWLVGRWVDEDEAVRIETNCTWSKNQNYLIRSFSVAAGDQVEMSGMQVIGWDAAEKTIRSWTFDSDGGFAEAVWSKKEDRWFIHNKGVLADGRKASMVNVIRPIDNDSFTWQTVERTVGGELLPNIKEVVIVRR